MTDIELINALKDTLGCKNQTEVGDILGLRQGSISGILGGRANLGGSARKFAEHLLADATSETERDAEKLRRIAAILSE